MAGTARHIQHVDVAGTGLTVLDRVYADGRLADECLGGSCGNVLASLATFNWKVAPVLCLGDDEEGERLVCEFVSTGAVTSYIHRRNGFRSPILAHEIDTISGTHRFSSVCPKTGIDLPRHLPIGETEVASALPVLNHCSVFYTDRLSESVLAAINVARAGGAVVFFEPSDVSDKALLEEAMTMVSILKYSVDRLGESSFTLPLGCVKIVTHGAAGLEIGDRDSTFWCGAINAPIVLDACGSGDMVSVGVLDWIIANQIDRGTLTAAGLVIGVLAGQRLAAENCAYAGARGVFRKRGAEYAQQVLRVRSAI